MAKIQPAVEKLYFEIPNHSGPGSSNKYIDLSQCTSIVNRRFQARQGTNWAVSGFEIFTVPEAAGSITILKIPNTWVAFNAWQKAFSAWLHQQNEAVKDAGAESAVARYRDFKIHADREHVAATFPTNLLPMDAVGNQFIPGEWEPSQVVRPNAAGVVGATDEFEMHMVGGDNAAPDSFGLITNYANSRAFPQSPDPAITPGAPAGSMYAQIQNVGMDDEEIIDNATLVNNDLPYDQDNYPGGGVQAPVLQVVDSWQTPVTVITNEQRLDGGTFPCGLIKITSTLQSPNAEVTSPATLVVHLVPGSQRGYLNQPMQDV